MQIVSIALGISNQLLFELDVGEALRPPSISDASFLLIIIFQGLHHTKDRKCEC